MLKKPTLTSQFKINASFKPQITRATLLKQNQRGFLSHFGNPNLQIRTFAFLVNPPTKSVSQAKQHEKPPFPIIKHEGTIIVGHEIKQPEDLISRNREEKKKKLEKQRENQIPFSKLSEEQKNQIRQLRTADPIKYSSSALQKMFNISPQTVARVAPCPDWRKQQLLEELSLTPAERRKRANADRKKNLSEWMKKQRVREATMKLSRKVKKHKPLNFAQLLDNMVLVDKQNKKQMKAAQKAAEAANSNAQQKS